MDGSLVVAPMVEILDPVFFVFDDLDVVGTLKCRRIGDAALAQLPAEGRQIFEAHHLHVVFELGQQDIDVRYAVAIERRGHHAHVSTRQEVLDELLGTLDTGGSRQRAGGTATQHGQPQQRQAYLLRAAEVEVVSDFELIDVKVGLVKPVKQHQATGSGLLEFFGHVGHRREIRIELDGNRNAHLFFESRQDVEVSLLHAFGRVTVVGRDKKHIELESIGPGLGYFFGVLQPAFRSDAV